MADGAVFAGVGEDLGAVDGARHVVDVQDAGAARWPEDMMEGEREEFLAVAGEPAV